MASIYEIELPDGQVVEVEGDAPPTIEQLNQYLGIEPEKGTLRRLADQFIESQKTEEQRDRELMGKARELLMNEPSNVAQPGDVQDLGDATLSAAKKVGPMAVRVGGPTAAILSLPTGVGTAPAVAYLAASGLLSENVARAIEGRQPTNFTEGTLAATTSSLLAPARVAPGAANVIMGGTLEGLGFASSAAVQQGRQPWEITAADAAVALPIGIGGRALESSMLARQAAKQTAATQKTYGAIAADEKAAQQAKVDALGGNPLAGLDDTVIPAGASPVDDYIARVNQFNQAKAELQAAELADNLRASQVGQTESVILAPGASTKTRLDVEMGPGQGALLERAKIATREAASPEGQARARVEAEFNRRAPRMSSQASRMAEEYGRIDPRIIAPMARAGIGFAAGAVQGDTPEEDIGYGLTYALTGAVMSPSLAKKAGNALLKGTEIGRKWVPEATLAPLMEAVRAGSRDSQALLVFPKAALNGLTRELNAIKDPLQRTAANAAVYEYLTGARHITTLPTNLAAVAQDARVAIDDLTDELITRGVAQGQLRDTLVNNTGSYLRRSYRIFTEPNWRPDPAVFDRWVSTHVADALANPRNKMTAAELKTYYTNTAQKLLDREVAEEFVQTGAYTMDTGIFKPRQDLSAVTRELLGEIDDPLILFSDTAPRMARNAANFQMKKNVVDIGERLGLFSRQAGSDPRRSVLMAPEGKAYDPFAGVWSTPEVRQAWNSIGTTEANQVLQWFATASSALKLPKTLGSLKAYSSNIWGGAMDVVANGHGIQTLYPENWRKALSLVGTNFKLANGGKIDRTGALSLYRDMVREGLVNKSVTGEDFVRTLEQSILGKGTGMGGKAVDNLSKAYMTPESMSKVFSLAGEMKDLKRAFPTMPREELFRTAAARVRATTADYDYLPKAIRKGSQYGALDPFIAYTADRFRVVYNSYKIAMEDMASGNRELQIAGAKRMAWMTGVLAAAGTFGANTHLRKEEEEALRRRLPPRDANGFLQISQRKPDGSFTYTNLNYNIPQSIVMEAASAATRGDDPEEAAKKFLSVVQEQLFGANLLVRPAVDVWRNQADSGRQVFSDNDDASRKAADAGMYLGKEWFMPLVFNEARKAYMASKEIATAAGQKYEVDDLLLSNFGGVRLYRIDLPTRFRADAAKLTESIARDQRDYSSAKRRSIGEDDKVAAYERFEARRRNAWEKTAQMVQDARTMGYSDEELVKMLKEGGIPSRLLVGAMDGLYLPTDINETLGPAEQFEEWEAAGIKTLPQLREKITAIAKTDRPRAMSLMNHLKDVVVDERRGITPAEKLMLSFPQADGSRARYISLKMDEIARTQGQEAVGQYRDELRRKRILTPVVDRQLMQIRMPSATR